MKRKRTLLYKYLVGPRATKERVRVLRIHIDRLVERPNSILVHALALEQLRKRELLNIGVVLLVHPVGRRTFDEAAVRVLRLLRLDLRLREEEQLRAEGHIVRNELAHVFR